MNLSERMKDYEVRFQSNLMRKTPTILRLDGKGFSKYTKHLNKPFDDGFADDMISTAIYLCENISGVKVSYVQSDEISLVLTDWETYETQPWFDNNVQKMVSVSAGLASAKFNQLRTLRGQGDILACFDSRVFQVPTVDEAVNVILWRQQDCTRNSISMAASANFSHKQLQGKSGNDKQDMLFTQKGINWNDYFTRYKRGVVISKKSLTLTNTDGKEFIRNKWVVDEDMPIISQDKNYLIKLIQPNE